MTPFLTMVLVVLAALPLSAEIIELPLSEMVKGSELIVRGEVVATQKTGDLDPRTKYPALPEGAVHFKYFKATLKVKKVLLGMSPTDTLYVDYRGTSTDAKFYSGQEVLVFLVRRDGILQTVAGYGGLVEIKGKMVGPIFIREEAQEQELERFVDKINLLVGR
jgi:hypothetical protein